MTEDRKIASRWRIELARELAETYAKHESVRMIVLGGSPSRGLADAYSDLDVVVYWEEMDVPWLEGEPLAPKGAERKFFRKMGEEAFLESYYFGPLKADFGHSTVKAWESWVGPVLRAEDPSPPMQKAMAGFLEAVPLYGGDLVNDWQSRIAVYPDGLAPLMVRTHLRFFQRGSLTHQGLERGDILFFFDGLCMMLKNLLGVLAGLNRVYFCPSEPRWLEFELESMLLKPRDCWPRMQKVLEGPQESAEDEVNELAREVLDLVEAHMPDVDISRIRRGFETEVAPCFEKPELGGK
jgi:hypothetical protein